MLNRILESLDSPRRHLAFLVSLLVLVFALSGVVAYRAMEAERSRSRAVAGVIDRGLERAAGEWASLYYMGLTNTLSDFAGAVVEPLLASGNLSAERIHDRMSGRLVCTYCERDLTFAHVFEISAADRSVRSATGAFDLDLLNEVIDTLLVDRSAVFNDRVKGIVYHGASGGQAHTILATGIMDPDSDEVLSAVGVVLSSESTLDLFESTFVEAQKLTGTATVVERVDSLYNRSVLVGGVHAFGDPIAEGSLNAPQPPIHGLQLAVGLRQSYAEGAYDSATKVIAIVGLLVLIAGLLLIAAAQIRRETQLMRLRADFISSVSHELRTPLAQIRMFVETLLLGRTRTDVERQRSLEIIEQEARRLSHLVENVLLFSKTEGGRMPRIAPEPTDLAADIRRAVDGFSLLSRSRSAELRTELQENVTAQVDRGALRQILVNTIDNALKYGPEGQRITVGAALFDDMARVWVDDEGPGIPEEARARVFESFYRLPRERQTAVPGSGIGLSVVRELARLHGGEVWAEEAPGGGARIVVQFPDAYLRSHSAGAMAAAS
jgi:signal transduction histidine kinase